MSLFDILDLIPKSLQQQALDALVDLVSGQAKKLLGEQASNKIKKLKSDASFAQAFREGLCRAAERFVQEYEQEDEDLVAAIAADESFFQNEQVQKALLTIIKKPGTYLVDERETVLRSFKTVLPGRKNRQRVDRAVTAFLKCLAEEMWTLPELQPIYSLQFQRMTAEATRQQVKLQAAQLQATIGLSVDIREALMQLTDTMGQQKLLSSPDALALPAPPKVYHNLPQPDYGTFIGREEELAQVHCILRPYPHSQHALVTIDGIGGIGKSALALEVVHRYLRDYDRLSSEERFEAIIWTSAKSSVLTADGIAPRQQITRTLDDIYATIAVTLEREGITRARPEEQDELVTKALTRQRTLLIVDNLETVDDERVNAFLRELPAPTKAIVTTRHRLDVAYPVRLKGMPKADGLALIAQECEKKGMTLTEAEAGNLYDRTGGVPLAIVWSVAQMGYGYSPEAVLRRLGDAKGDIARYCFEGVVDRIRGNMAHRLLMALSVFATDASREALGYVADLAELDRDDGLAELDKLSLLNRQAGRFSLLPLTRSYLASELERMPQFDQSAFERMLTYYKQLVAPPPEVQVGIPYWDGLLNRAGEQSLEQESSNLTHVIRRALDQGRYAPSLDLFLYIVHFLYRWGLWDERLRLSREMCQAAHKLGDSAEAWLWIDAIGSVLHQRQQFSESIHALKTGKALAHQFGLHEAAILADVYEARLLYSEMDDPGLASEKVDRALEQLDLGSVLERGAPVRRIVARRAVGMAALLSEREQDFVRAKEWYELALELRRSIGEHAASTLQRLADISLKLDDITSAGRFLAEASAGAGKKDWPGINYSLAAMAEKKGELKEAQHLCLLALEQFTRLGQERGMQGCRELLTRLQE
jgi:LuxR family glucitol operon transcriptional activator